MDWMLGFLFLTHQALQISVPDRHQTRQYCCHHLPKDVTTHQREIDQANRHLCGPDRPMIGPSVQEERQEPPAPSPLRIGGPMLDVPEHLPAQIIIAFD